MEETRRMMRNGTKRATLFSMVMLAALAAGCSTKKPIPPPPPQGPTPTGNNATGKPSITFTAEPSTIDRGQSAILRWTVADANYISIDTFGAVQASGSRSVTPYSTTEYHLTADGPGGRSAATATITVNLGQPPAPPAENPNAGADTRSLGDRLHQQVQDVFFAYDKFDIEDDGRTTLTRDAEALKAIFRDFPNASLIIEGHCDERGSAEYNLGLGDRRATSTRDFLVQLGVPTDKLKTVSYGKERPVCTDATEECYARNRRAHIAPAQ
jgi:peptidoglycan-associated lipoprotein